jgi:hypothetical protein
MKSVDQSPAVEYCWQCVHFFQHKNANTRSLQTSTIYNPSPCRTSNAQLVQFMIYRQKIRSSWERIPCCQNLLIKTCGTETYISASTCNTELGTNAVDMFVSLSPEGGRDSSPPWRVPTVSSNWGSSTPRGVHYLTLKIRAVYTSETSVNI